MEEKELLDEYGVWVKSDKDENEDLSDAVDESDIAFDDFLISDNIDLSLDEADNFLDIENDSSIGDDLPIFEEEEILGSFSIDDTEDLLESESFSLKEEINTVSMENNEVDNQPEILQSILDEIRSIKADIDNIKLEIGQLKKKSSAKGVPTDEEAFLDDENETIALSTNELNNIIMDSDESIPSLDLNDEEINDNDETIEEEFFDESQGLEDVASLDEVTDEVFTFISLEENDTIDNEDIDSTEIENSENDLDFIDSESTNFADKMTLEEELQQKSNDNTDIIEDDSIFDDNEEDIFEDEDFFNSLDESLSSITADEKQGDVFIDTNEYNAAKKNMKTDENTSQIEEIDFENDLDFKILDVAEEKTITEKEETVDFEDETISLTEDELLDVFASEEEEVPTVDSILAQNKKDIDETNSIFSNLSNPFEEMDEDEETALDDISLIDDEDITLDDISLIEDEDSIFDDISLIDNEDTTLDDISLINDEDITLDDISLIEDEDSIFDDISLIDNEDTTLDDISLIDEKDSIDSDSEEKTVSEAENIDEPQEQNAELVELLGYLDRLLDSLPEEKIREFANSRYFDLYKKTFKELGIN